MKQKFNLDKAKFCYKVPDGLFDYLSAYQIGDFICRDGYSLRVLSNDGKAGTNENTKISVGVEIPEVGYIGDIHFSNSRKYNNLCFFEAINRIFYQNTQYPCNTDRSDFDFVSWVAEDLGLKLNSVTCIEVACDISIVASEKLRQLIRNCKEYELIYRNKSVSDDERLFGFLEVYGRTRTQRDKYPTLYAEMANNDEVKLKVYDKKKEIVEESGKHYITAWNEFARTFWRLEVSAFNTDVHKWIAFCHTSNNDLIWTEDLPHFVHRICDSEYRKAFWIWQINRLIRFNRRTDGKHITVYDVIKGRKNRF